MDGELTTTEPSVMEPDGDWPNTLAIIHEALGDKEEALDHVERAWQGREPVLLALGTAFLPMKSLADEPRFQAVLRAVHERLGIEA